MASSLEVCDSTNMADVSESWGSVDESLRRRFEAAWKEGTAGNATIPDVAAFLPPADDSRYPGTLAELLLIDLEMGWRNGQPRMFETYRKQFPLLRTDSALAGHLVNHEFQIRHRHGDRPSPEEFRRQYPDLADAVRTLVQNVTQPAQLHSGDSPNGPLDVRYRIDAEQGRGGFGMVWRATDNTLGREVAVKQLIGATANDSELRRRFLAEARIAAQLQHPGVVPVYDIGGDTDRPYYTMKLVAGRTLAQAIRDYHALPDDVPEKAIQRVRLLNAFQSVVRTMAYVHAQGVLHRDLKPQNIILGDYGETILLDWGLAKVLETPTDTVTGSLDSQANPEMTMPGTVMGTPAYMSPEQASGKTGEIDRRSDVFSLGIILYQILTGTRPFAGADTAEICARILREDPTPPRAMKKGISRRLEAVCLNCLSKHPDDRYRDAGALSRDLERYFADESVTAYAEPWWFRLRQWSGRHRARIAIGALGLILAAVVIGASFAVRNYQRQRDDQAIARVKEAEEAAVRAEALAMQRVRQNAFYDAERLLADAVSKISQWPELDNRRVRLDKVRSRVHRLGTFYQYQDDGWRCNYYEYDGEAEAAMKRALDALGVIDNPAWWDSEEFEELSQEQRRQLREDSHALLMLYAGTIAKPALQDFPFTRYKDDCKKALALCRQAQAFRPTQSGSLVELFCRYGVGELGILQLPQALSDLKPKSPTTPNDFHIMGVGHMILTWNDNPLKQYFSLLKKFGDIGLDWDTPAFTSQRYLREVTRFEPKRFWAYVWLGTALKFQNDPLGSELAYNTCVTLRPDDPLGYCGRAQALYDQAHAKGITAAQKKLLLARGRDDFDRAVQLDPLEPEIRLVRWQAAGRLGEYEAAREDCFHYYNLFPPLSHLQKHGHQKMHLQNLDAMEKTMRGYIADPKQDAPMFHAILATILYHRGKTDDALREIEGLPEDAPERRRMNPLHAWMLVESPDPLKAETIDRIETSIAHSPEAAFRSKFAKARLAIRRGENAQALSTLQEMDARPKSWTSWQRLEILLEMARVQSALGQSDAAQTTLARARLSHGPIADLLAKR